MKELYLLVNLFTVIIPVVFSFHPRLQFYKKFQFFLRANMITAIIFIAWDIFFTHLGVWGFNQDYLSGIYFFNLPIEEVLFFICIPYACVFTYHCLNLFFQIKWKTKFESAFIISFASVLLVAGIYFHNKLYTAVTFISLSILLLLLKFMFRVKWLPGLFSIYPLLLVPFFIVNGILTGFGLQQPVVWYNDSENIGVRLFTIPVEDIFYGFELILINIFFYEFFLSFQMQKRKIHRK